MSGCFFLNTVYIVSQDTLFRTESAHCVWSLRRVAWEAYYELDSNDSETRTQRLCWVCRAAPSTRI